MYNVLVSEYPLLLRITPPLCHGDATGSIEVVFALSQNEYVWSNGQTGALADSLEAGSYQLLVNTVVGVVIDTVLHLQEPDSLAIDLLDIQPVLC
ncbi:hypothetical protein RZS08_34530, partial [Arthrospira platensis SPKY1]|nr:hypothetical protein [Arthrospira platensis SPKY1]